MGLAPFPGFCGAAYQSQSLAADAQRSVNFYLERNESGGGQSEYQMYGTPGLSRFATLTGMRNVRQMMEFSGSNKVSRLLAVGEDLTWQKLWEIQKNGTVTAIGQLGAAYSPVSMAANNANQILMSSSGRLFLLNLTTTQLSEVDTTTQTKLQAPVQQILFVDGYFIALLVDGRFQISGLLDGNAWDPSLITRISYFPENPVQVFVDHREVWVQGPKQSVVYYNSGNVLFPFEPIPGAFMETGGLIVPAKMDNSLFWIHQDERGQGMAWRAQGYTPQRISTHAIEQEWKKYSKLSDAESYTYQDGGHANWVISFPSADKTWVFDAATSSWHERSRLLQGRSGAHRSRCHAFFDSKHLVGDRYSGNIYEMSDRYGDDDGSPIQRIRRAPYVAKDYRWITFPEFVLHMEVGLGPQPPLLEGSGDPRSPKGSLRYSDDGAKTFSNYLERDLGKAGEYKTLATWKRLGKTRIGRCFEFSYSDISPIRIVGAYLDVA